MKNKTTTHIIDLEKLDKAHKLLMALLTPTKIKVMKVLCDNTGDDLTITDITIKSRITGSFYQDHATVSTQVNQLKEIGLVSTNHPKGQRFTYVTVNTDKINEINKTIHKFTKHNG